MPGGAGAGLGGRGVGDARAARGARRLARDRCRRRRVLPARDGARVIRVFLADDERLIRQGFRKLLELDVSIEVVGEAADGAEALALLPAAAPDVLLLDVRMPRCSGLDVLD